MGRWLFNKKRTPNGCSFWRRRRDSNWYILDFTMCRGVTPSAAKCCNSRLFREVNLIWCQCVPTGFIVERVRVRVEAILPTKKISPEDLWREALGHLLFTGWLLSTNAYPIRNCICAAVSLGRRSTEEAPGGPVGMHERSGITGSNRAERPGRTDETAWYAILRHVSFKSCDFGRRLGLGTAILSLDGVTAGSYWSTSSIWKRWQ